MIPKMIHFCRFAGETVDGWLEGISATLVFCGTFGEVVNGVQERSRLVNGFG